MLKCFSKIFVLNASFIWLKNSSFQIWVVLGESGYTMDNNCLFWKLIRCLKFFPLFMLLHLWSLYISSVCAFLCVVHTSHNRHEFHLRSLRFSFLSIPYSFRFSSLTENKLFLMPKLSNAPTNLYSFYHFYHDMCTNNITVSAAVSQEINT